MIKINFPKKAGTVLFRAAVFLILLEICFRSGSVILNSITDLQTRLKLANKEGYIILCLGDSMTEPILDVSYSLYLQELLDKNYPNRRVKVVTKAEGGYNSSMILKEAPAWIEQVKPNMVIVMMGAFDAPDEKAEHNFLHKLVNTFYVSRVLNGSLKSAKNQITQNLAKTKNLLQNKIWLRLKPDQKAPVDKQMAQQIVHMAAYLRASLLESAGLNAEALKYLFWLVKAPGLDGGLEAKAYQMIMKIFLKTKDYPHYIQYMHNTQQYTWFTGWPEVLCTQRDFTGPTIMQLTAKINKDPNDPIYYDLLSVCYEKAGFTVPASKIKTKASELRKNAVYESTRKNHEELINFLFQKGIQPVVMVYPMRDGNQLKAALEHMDGYARVIFVDNGPSFRQGVSSEGYDAYFKDRHLGDSGHETVKGNRLIANNVFAEIKKIFD